MCLNGWCKHCVGAPVLIPVALDLWRNYESLTSLPMRAGAGLGAGFASAVVFFIYY